MGCQVIFQPSGRRGIVEEGKTLLEAARELGVDIESPCGAIKVCGKCRVKVEEGFFEKLGIESRRAHLAPLSDEEKETLSPADIADGYRLACAARVEKDVLVFVPEESRGAKQVVLETGRENRFFELDPAIRNYYVEMKPASLEDHRDDWTRLKEALIEKYGRDFGRNSGKSSCKNYCIELDLELGLEIDYPALLELPEVLRAGGWKVTATVWNGRSNGREDERENEPVVTRVQPGWVEKVYGLAVDIGTTTVAAYLCDLTDGRQLVRDSMMNPQVSYGEDVISRITYAMMNEDGLEKLNRAIIEGVNTLLARMAGQTGIEVEDIMEVVLVFNTAMHHMALNINPKYVGRSPFVPAAGESMDLKARDLGIKVNKGALVHALPVIAGFVGPDNVAVLIAEEPYKQDSNMLLIDIGTNGEIDLGNGEKLFCTSCATGPALEGAQIAFGMRAAPGAIQRVQIDPETLEPRYNVIGMEEWYPEVKKTESNETGCKKTGVKEFGAKESGAKVIGAKGICGSGIIDVIAEMFKAGIILPSGRFNKSLTSPRVRAGSGGKPEYVLAWAEETSIGKDITVTQADVRAVQLAKAALYVGAKILMKYRGIERVDSVTLAGAFGSYIDKNSAMVIGMFPDCDPDKVRAVGNAAGDGAKLALLDKKKRVEANRVARQVEFIEAAVEPDFQEQFAEAMSFPHARDKFPHIEHILEKIAGLRK